MRSTAARGSGAHVLAEVDREVGLAVGLVGRERAARHLAQDARSDRREPRALRRARRLVATKRRTACAAGVVAHVERAVLADHPSTGHIRAM